MSKHQNDSKLSLRNCPIFTWMPGEGRTLMRQEAVAPSPCGIPYTFGAIGSPAENVMPAAPLDKGA